MGGKTKSTNNQMVQFEMEQAQEARDKENQRQARLTSGKQAVDDIFAGGGFDDAFYNKYKDAKLGYDLPQLEDQYNKRKEQTTYDLARAGLLRSTAAGQAQADLELQKSMNEAGIRAGADQGVADLRKSIANEQSAALSQLYATEDPNVAANTAIQSVQQGQLSTPALSPLGELFKPLVIGGAGALGSIVDNYNMAKYLSAKSSTGQGAYGPGSQG